VALDSDLKRFANGENFAVLTTLFADGSPQTHVMWVGADDEHVLINTEVHRQKFANVERDPRVAVTIWELGRPYAYIEVRGRVVDTVRGDAARRHIDELSNRYVGEDYPNEVTSERVILKIAPDRVLTRGL
jgi:PPOX class probable F420-dependent enzyme